MESERNFDLETWAEAYKRLNQSYRRKLIYRFGTGGGFYSELNGLLLAVLYALDRGYRFELYSRKADFCMGGGWTAIFEPFCPEYKNRLVGSCVLRDRRYNTLRNKVTSFYKLLNRNITEDDVFWYTHTNRFAIAQYNIPELGIINGSFKDAMRRLIPIVCRFNASFRREIDDFKQKMGLPEHYVSMHIRGGDKENETESFSPQAYVDAAAVRTTLRTAFVFTDDYRLFEELRAGNPDWTFFTSATKEDAGYRNETFRAKGKEIRADLVKMFSSVKMILESDLFVGTFISNPAMFAGMLMDDEKLVGLDYLHWLLL